MEADVLLHLQFNLPPAILGLPSILSADRAIACEIKGATIHGNESSAD